MHSIGGPSRQDELVLVDTVTVSPGQELGELLAEMFCASHWSILEHDLAGSLGEQAVTGLAEQGGQPREEAGAGRPDTEVSDLRAVLDLGGEQRVLDFGGHIWYII